MNLDRTFCSGSRCDRIATCDRSMFNLKRWMESLPDGTRQRFEGRPLSVAQFADHDGKCNRYSPIEETDVQAAQSLEDK